MKGANIMEEKYEAALNCLRKYNQEHILKNYENMSQNQKEKHRPQAHLSLRCNTDYPACSPDKAFLSYAAFLKLCTETP